MILYMDKLKTRMSIFHEILILNNRVLNNKLIKTQNMKNDLWQQLKITFKIILTCFVSQRLCYKNTKNPKRIHDSIFSKGPDLSYPQSCAKRSHHVTCGHVTELCCDNKRTYRLGTLSH